MRRDGADATGLFVLDGEPIDASTLVAKALNGELKLTGPEHVDLGAILAGDLPSMRTESGHNIRRRGA